MANEDRKRKEEHVITLHYNYMLLEQPDAQQE